MWSRVSLRYLRMLSASLLLFSFFFFFKQKTAYEMRISDWSSDVCSSDLISLDHMLALTAALVCLLLVAMTAPAAHAEGEPAGRAEIGRASCRERVCQYV